MSNFYKFEPKKDITAFELAILLKYAPPFVNLDTDPRAHRVIEGYEFILSGAARHFVSVGKQDE